MENTALRGRSILVVEGETRVAMETAAALKGAGAYVTMTTSVPVAVLLAEHDYGLSAAILLSDDDRPELCARLTARGVPYVSHGGHSVDELMNALKDLLAGNARPAASASLRA